jgi:LEA14-like dessication related protein
MSKTDLLFQMTEQPLAYSDQQWQEILSDEECRELYALMAKSRSAFDVQKEIDDETINAEWKKLTATSNRRWLRVAAMFIGILMITGIAYAAIQHVIKIERKPKVTALKRKPNVRKVKDVYGLAVAPTGAAPVLYNNVELQQIMQYISDGYNVNIVFKNDSVRTVRFYLQWEADDTLQEIIERINHFKKVRLTLAEETIIIE